MPQWMQDLTTGWPMIRANLPTFAVILVLMVAVVWWFVNLIHSGNVSNRDSIISNKDSEIALLRSQRDEYKNKLSGATPDEAKAKIDALESRVARIEPRSLNEKQSNAITLALRLGAPSSVIVTHEGSCIDCATFAAEISIAFQNAGWKVTENMMMGNLPRPQQGGTVLTDDLSKPSIESLAIAKALNDAGVPFALAKRFQPRGAQDPETQVLVTARGRQI